MTSTPDPLDQPVDTAGSDAAGEDSPSAAPVSTSPAEADSDIGYSRGDEGESVEQAGPASGDTGGADYVDDDTWPGSPGDQGNA